MNIISKYKHNITTVGLSLFLLSSLSLFNACSSDDDNQVVPEEGTEAFLRMNFRAVDNDIMNNTKLFVFDTTDKFKQLQYTTREVDTLSAKMVVGNYNLVLLSANGSYAYNTPSVNSPMASSLMFKLGTDPLHNDTLLKEAPELRYDKLTNVPIISGQTTKESSILNRNVVKIKVVLDTDASVGISPAMGQNFANAFVSLYNVPTSLTWDGNFALDGSSKPIVDSRPLRKAFNVTQVAPSLKVDTVSFIVPAHRGNEFDSDGKVTVPESSIVPFSHKFRIRVGLPVGGTVMIKDVELTRDDLLRPNHIVVLTVKFIGEPDGGLYINPYVVPWSDYIEQNDVIQ